MKDLIKRLGILFWKIQIVWLFAYGAMAAVAFFETDYLKKLIDIYFANRTVTENYSYFLKYIFIVALSICIDFFNVLLSKHVTKKLYTDLSERIARRFLNLKWYDVYSSSAADTVKLINNDLNKLIPILFGFFPRLTIHIFAIGFYCVYLFFKTELVTVLLLGAFTILFVISKTFDKILKQDSNAQREAYVQKESFIMNMYNNFRYIFANRKSESILNDFNAVNEVHNETSVRIAYHSGVSGFLYTAVTTVTVLLAFVILFFLKQKNTAITAGLAVQISVLISQALKYFSTCLRSRNQLSAAVASIDRINNLFAREAAGFVPENLPQTAEIVSENVSEKLSFKAHRINLICGANGKGKTTLLNTLCGLEHKYLPEIKLSGSVSDKNKKEKLCYVTNTIYLRNGTVLDNIAENCEQLNSDVDGILQKVGLIGKTEVKNYGENLSAGQRQIVHLLKLLGSCADVFIMDEPDSALSYESRLWLYETLETLVKTQYKTVVLVSHNKNIAENFDSDIVNMCS